MTWGIEEYTLVGIGTAAIAFVFLKLAYDKRRDFEKAIILLFLSLVFILISFIFTLPPIFSKYILILNPNDSNAGSTAVIVSITLGLAFCGPVFLFILDRIKKEK